ncbi:serine/threonine-protein kinase 1 [Piscirickettsia salmonis]|uniref:Kinase domain protein n=3 Tax=Piscirickettsia salmonis TaxID=1238 RepID=A0AAC8VFP9_PISSA|nr:serine/threonine-protein kinase [Piscirickettsia salmonis]AKP73091.2 hypothetical protein PSLF89_1069 [Piscirickettsia salmonis LF-89 = ATCC VR-1361]ALB21743.1 kinase domain protein [Piscirickettsia salmonis]ALY01933.1 hypothetical protein AWE47_02830 [Piscirickettsia salmonis]AMA41441.1 hypothetical protein AWJ11_02815 [Piscirickettsia salmonis]AOS33930.1 hypothetical protein AVM72_00070 [Piscirickettsia salmonis]
MFSKSCQCVSPDTLKSYPHRTDEVIVAVALELHRLHLLKMQHGDIKFDNIIITEKNGVFDVKFIDFGFAYNIPGLARIITGKCEYFPPERTETTDQTQVVAQFNQDIYSFGFMLEFAKKIIKIPEKFNDFIKATQNKNPTLRPGLQSFLYKNLLPTTLNNRSRNVIIKRPDSYQTMRVIALTGDDLNHALNHVPQFESCYQKLTELNLSQQACIHKVLNNITGFNQSYLCLKAIRDETQQVYQEVKAELGSESQIHDLSNRFKQYQSQAMQAAFDYLMAKEPSLQQLTEQLSQRKRRYLGRYFAHPMMQNRRAKRDDYKPSAVRVTQRYVP